MQRSRCWCGHQERWHTTLFVDDVCRWCVRMEQRHPQFNFMPHHEFASTTPEQITQEAADIIAQVLRGAGRGDGEPGWFRNWGK